MRAQERVQRQRAEARAARRKSFERAQERGLTVRDIAEEIEQAEKARDLVETEARQHQG
jgi:hypothetical protein